MSLENVSQRLDAVEAELDRLGLLEIPAPESLEVKSAFGYGEMALEQWIVHIFLPNARAGVDSGHLPANSQVGVAAMRNFDGDAEKESLVSLLSAFDQSVLEHAGSSSTRASKGFLGSLVRKLSGRR